MRENLLTPCCACALALQTFTNIECSRCMVQLSLKSLKGLTNKVLETSHDSILGLVHCAVRITENVAVPIKEVTKNAQVLLCSQSSPCTARFSVTPFQPLAQVIRTIYIDPGIFSSWVMYPLLQLSPSN